jgi:predicted DNA-binding transcriptional regulator AlpA
MNTLTPTFDQLPYVVAQLTNELQELKNLLLQKVNSSPEIETPININGVSKLTELSLPTLYGYVQRNEIPYYKKGNRLKFFTSEIIDWIKTGKQKTVQEVETETDNYLSKRKKR